MPERKYVGHLQLELRNIACFTAFQVDLKSGEVTEVTGGNGRGKTTLLGMLKSTVTGAQCKFPDWLVTDFEEKGSIRASIDDQVTVQRDIRQGDTASSLSLLNEYGEPLNGGKRPLETLRSIFGEGVYLNPVEVVAMRPIDRTKAIASALDISPANAATALENITGRAWKIPSREKIFDTIAEAHDTLYELRRQKRNDWEAADAQADGVLAFLPAEWMDAKGKIDPPREPESLGDVYDRKKNSEIRNGEREQLARNIAELEESLRTGDERIAGYEVKLSEEEGRLQRMGTDQEDEAALEVQIRELQADLVEMQERNRSRRSLKERGANAREAIRHNKETLEESRARLKELQAREFELGGYENVDALQAKIDAHEDQMAIYREALKVHGERGVRHQQVEELREKAAALHGEWEALEKKVHAIDLLPIQLLDGVPVPIPGMMISGEDIFLPDGEVLRKFDAFGDADKMRFAARIAIELAPVNILLLDGVEKCDEDRRIELYRMAAESGFIVFSTRVTRGPLDVNHITREQLADHGPERDALTLPAVE